MYGCLSWVRSLAKALPSKLLYCAQYRVILYRDILRVYINGPLFIWFALYIHGLVNIHYCCNIENKIWIRLNSWSSTILLWTKAFEITGLQQPMNSSEAWVSVFLTLPPYYVYIKESQSCWQVSSYPAMNSATQIFSKYLASGPQLNCFSCLHITRFLPKWFWTSLIAILLVLMALSEQTGSAHFRLCPRAFNSRKRLLRPTSD